VFFINDIINLIKTFESPKFKQVFGRTPRLTEKEKT